ncbi:MAG: sulfotransferase [Candidatus Electrothrix sp. AR3]|nr:sulfotransferase [Candidatus Electrothrix sp. AR3]
MKNTKYKANDLDINFTSQTSPIIIGGTGRSGTTLLRVMLDTHPNLCAGPETWLFTPQLINVSQLAKNFDISEKNVLNILHQSRSRGEFIDIFFTKYLNQCGKRRWAEKTPANIENMDFIFKTFPDARFIEMVRDGRDVVCSLRTFPRHKVVNDKLVPLNTWNPLDQCIKRWIQATEHSRPYWNHPQYMRVRYEDLINQTEATLYDVCAFIGELFDSSMLQYYKITRQSRDTTRFPQNPEATKPLYKNAINRWKSDFCEQDKRMFKIMSGDLLEIFGYETSSDW